MSGDKQLEKNAVLVMDYVKHLRSKGYDALVERDKFTVERTVKSLEIFMTASLSLLGFVSLGFFFEEDLCDCIILLLIFFFVLGISAFVLSFLSRYLILRKNEEVFAERGMIAETIDMSIGDEFEKMVTNAKYLECKLEELKEKESKRLKQASAKLRSSWLELMYWGCFFLMLSQVLMFVFIVSIMYFT